MEFHRAMKNSCYLHMVNAKDSTDQEVTPRTNIPQGNSGLPSEVGMLGVGDTDKVLGQTDFIKHHPAAHFGSISFCDMCFRKGGINIKTQLLFMKVTSEVGGNVQ